MSDLNRIKSNVGRMIDQGAPEADVDQYLSEEGVNSAQLRGEQPHPAKAPSVAPTPQAPAPAAPMPNGPDTTPTKWTDGNGNPVAANGMPVNFKAEEAAYQASKRNQPTIVNHNPAPAPTNYGNGAMSEAIGLGDSMMFGHLDEFKAGLDTFIPGLGKTSIWNGTSLSNAYDQNLELNRKALEVARQEHPYYFGIGTLGGALATPLGGVGKLPGLGAFAAKEVNAATRLGRFGQRAASGAKEGAVFGGLYGEGSAEGNPIERLVGKRGDITSGGIAGAVMGAGAGAVMSPILGPAIEAVVKGPAKNFITKQRRDNPFASYDAEIAGEVKSLLTDTARSPTDPKARAAVTVKMVNNLEQTYQLRFKEMINALDIPAAEKMSLKGALDADYSTAVTTAEGLRGTPQGDAVADAIIKTQRLRQLTPEIKRGGIASWAKTAMEIGGNIAGPLVSGNPLGAVAGTVARRALSGAEGEAARANAAERLIKKAPRYAQLAEEVGPSGATTSKNRLIKLYEDTVNGKEADAAAQAADAASQITSKDMRGLRSDIAQPIAPEEIAANVAAQDASSRRKLAMSAATRLATSSDAKLTTLGSRIDEAVPASELPIPTSDTRQFRQSIANPEPAPGDLQFPQPTDSQLARKIQARNAAVSQMETKANNFDINAPRTSAPSRASAEQQGITDNIARGIQGTSGVQRAFADQVGVPVPDMLRALDGIAERYPGMAADIERIKNGYPTAKRGLAPILVPAMRQALTEDGTMAAAQAANEAAQTRITARMAAEKSTPATASAAPAPSLPLEPTAPPATLAEQAVPDAVLPVVKPTAAEVADRFPKREDFASQDEYLKAVRGDGQTSGPLAIHAEDMAPAAPRPDVSPDNASMRPVDRPTQWQQGKDRYLGQATQRINDLYGDESLPESVFSAIKGDPEIIRDSFRNVADAKEYIHSQVVPSLEADGIVGDTMRHVRDYLLHIAEAKPYATAADYEAGTAARPSGRPKKK